MNVPALKCARGYHKRGREFKVLYSRTGYGTMTEVMQSAHAPSNFSLLRAQYFRLKAYCTVDNILKCNVNSGVAQPCQAFQICYHFLAEAKKIYMLNQFGVSLPVLNTKEEEFMNNPRQSKANIFH